MSSISWWYTTHRDHWLGRQAGSIAQESSSISSNKTWIAELTLYCVMWQISRRHCQVDRQDTGRYSVIYDGVDFHNRWGRNVSISWVVPTLHDYIPTVLPSPDSNILIRLAITTVEVHGWFSNKIRYIQYYKLYLCVYLGKDEVTKWCSCEEI